MLAAGGEACIDIEQLRAQPELFGEVTSNSTLYRVITGMGADGPGARARVGRLGPQRAFGGRRRLDFGGGPFGELGLRRAELQGRLRVPPDGVLYHRWKVAVDKAAVGKR